MEFSTIGAEDSLEEAKSRLKSVDALVVWGSENILGVLTEQHLGDPYGAEYLPTLSDQPCIPPYQNVFCLITA